MTAMVRTAVIERLVTVIDAEATGVDVVAHIPTDAPGDHVPREWIGMGQTTGTVEITSFRGGSTASYVDSFEINVVCVTSIPGVSSLAARQRCGVLVQAVIDAIRADPGLTSPSGITGFASLQLGDVDGPNAYPLGERTGYGAEAEVKVRGLTHKLGS